MANLFPAPANLFNTLTPPLPLVAVANKPSNMAPCLVRSTRKLRIQIPLASGDDNTNVVNECVGLESIVQHFSGRIAQHKLNFHSCYCDGRKVVQIAI